MTNRNTWPLNDGSPAVRPGMRRILSYDCVGGVTLGRYQYITLRSGATFILRNTSTSYATSSAITGNETLPAGTLDGVYASILGEVIFAAPGVAHLHGYLGGRMSTLQVPDRGVVRGVPTVQPPFGGVTGWAGRAVYCDTEKVMVSDPLLPRAVGAQNTIIPSAGVEIHSVHTVSGGSLMVVTSGGVWAIDRSAASVNVLIDGTLERVCGFRSVWARSAAVCAGRLWGITRTGVRQIDSVDGPEITVSEPVVFSTASSRRGFDLSQSSSLFGDENYLWLCHEAGTCVINPRTGHTSWWDTDTTGRVNGIGSDVLGHPMFFAEGGVFRIYGNVDYASDRTARGGVITPVLTARNQVMRAVHVMTDGPASYLAHRGGVSELTPVPLAPVLNTADFSTATMAESELQSKRHDVAQYTDEHAVELGAVGPLSRFRIESKPESTSVSPGRP